MDTNDLHFELGLESAIHLKFYVNKRDLFERRFLA